MKAWFSVLLWFVRTLFRTPAPLLVVSLLGGAVYMCSRFVAPVPDIKYVSLTGNISVRQKQELQVMLADINLEQLRLDSIKARLKSVDWVADVSVRRHWPNHLLINIKPEIALALWNQNEFINTAGHIYRSRYSQSKRLPQLHGPSGSEIQVIDRYREISSLMLKANKSIRLLKLDDRGSWLIVDDAGVEVILGRDEITRRIRDMLLVTARIESMGRSDQIHKIDTRYANGLAIAWKASVPSMGDVDGIKMAQNYNNQRALRL